MLTRTSFRFSPNGTYVACVAAERPGEWRVESWPVEPPLPPRPVPGLVPVGAQAQVLPLDDGRVLLCQPCEGGHEVVVATPGGGVRPLAFRTELGLRLVEHPAPGALAVAVGTYPDETSALWQLRDAEPALSPVTEVPGLLAGGGWLDAGCRRLGVNQAYQGSLRAVAVDVTTGDVEPLWPDAPGRRIALTVPRTGRHVIADGDRLGWTDERTGRVHWSTALAGLSGAIVLAADPDGTRIAVRTDDGARCGLLVVDTATDHPTELPLPAGVAGGTASWAAGGLLFPFAGPGHPPGIAVARPGTGEPVRMLAPARGTYQPIRVDRFAGPVGPVETVTYGDRRGVGDLVIALHGGPDAAWRLDGDPLLHDLAGTGLAVVAVNPRGGRGAPGADGGWGEVDLADVQAVAREMGESRGTPLALLGTSYGAYLGLLALGTEPSRWDRAVLVAPFLSGSRLHADAGVRVRALVERLGLDGRDALDVAGAVTARLLIVHGERDEVVPVDHSRRLVARLREAGVDVTYLEVADGGHDPFAGAGGDQVVDRVRGFLTAARSAPTVGAMAGAATLTTTAGLRGGLSSLGEGVNR